VLARTPAWFFEGNRLRRHVAVTPTAVRSTPERWRGRGAPPPARRHP